MQRYRWLLIPLTTTITYVLIYLMREYDEWYADTYWPSSESGWGFNLILPVLLIFFVTPMILALIVREKRILYGALAFILNIGVVGVVFLWDWLVNF